MLSCVACSGYAVNLLSDFALCCGFYAGFTTFLLSYISINSCCMLQYFVLDWICSQGIDIARNVVYHIGMVVLFKEAGAMTLKEYRIMLGWSPSELARRSGVASRTINRIEGGKPTYDYTLGAIARAISTELGRTVTIHDFDGVSIIST